MELTMRTVKIYDIKLHEDFFYKGKLIKKVNDLTGISIPELEVISFLQDENVEVEVKPVEFQSISVYGKFMYDGIEYIKIYYLNSKNAMNKNGDFYCLRLDVNVIPL